MSRKIIGVTVGTQLPKPNFKQTDPTKGDYIKNKPDFEGLKSQVNTVSDLVGDKKVSVQISEAIANQDHFSGDYNDLENRPNITENNSKDVVITDEDGNIIFKVDEAGVHTTALTLNGEDVQTTFDTYILTIDYEKLLAFDIAEIVIGGANTSAVLGKAILGQMVLG